MRLPDEADIERASEIVYEAISPTPQRSWPLLNERLGIELWIKHENYTPVGAFKVRGALVYLRHLHRSEQDTKRVVAATRGNHGQAVGFAAGREGMKAIVYVPHGNSVSKNRAMRGLGVTLLEFGYDFEEARQEALRCASAEGLHFVPSFHDLLVRGAATYAHELVEAVRDIDVVYVPIGLGSGICGMCAARDALGLTFEIVGVVSADALAYRESFVQRRPVESPAKTELADGLACRVPNREALEVIWERVARVVTVSDEEVAAAMRIVFDDTHNVSEGAGAAGVAAVMKEQHRLRGKRVATVLCGGNVDRDVFARVLQGG